MTELSPRYDHRETEGKIYELWEKSGYFNPDTLGVRSDTEGHRNSLKPFCIIMPPPNANGALHVGHAVFVTLQDIMIRFWRMRGRRALWLPGADHAGFETQVVFDKKLEKEGRNRFTMDRETLWKEMFDFTQKNKVVMENQLRKLGASCDWSREKFTLDPDIVKVVYDTFKKLYAEGLAYRALRVINWCPKHRTALSDVEVKYVERTDPLYYIKYGPLTLATVRPETKFGDTAIAVNPKDKRYQKYIGREIEAQGLLGPFTFKVIGDEAVDPKFGTGVVKVTPAHDATDFEIWQRHKDEIAGPKIVIDENGRLTGETGPFAGLKVAEAREKVAEEMKRIGILEKVDPNYVHQIATCYKCNSTLEPLPKPQWFVKMKPLAEKAIRTVKTGKIKLHPDRSKKVYFHWLENIRDWNISRQIVWGIRIPAWFHEPKCVPKRGHEEEIVKCKEIVIAVEKPTCVFCDAQYVQDPDVFDTWFSSGQWPFAALLANGQSSKLKVRRSNFKHRTSNDFKTFYPTDVMETGYDILFFWVTRMVMLGLYRTGEVPFRTVYLHGLVRDKDRQKMSKSKGNVIDPLAVAETYGADALRMALVIGNTPGNDIVISEDKIRAYRNFATKLWNVARFVLLHRTEPSLKKRYEEEYSKELRDIDRKGLSEIKNIKEKVTKHLEKLEFHLAAETLYHYVWHTLADKEVESLKRFLQPVSRIEDQVAAREVVEKLLVESLKMLHPFMPFVTEEIWQKLLPAEARAKEGRPGRLLMTEKW